MPETVIDTMLEDGLVCRVSASTLDEFINGEQLTLLFFGGGKGQRRESHDVAVALRELLKDYGSQVSVAVIASADEAELQQRFRVAVLPSLVFVLAGEALEVLPGVKDWGVYTAAFQRYLGAPQAITNLMERSV
jgi:hypothetical protein